MNDRKFLAVRSYSVAMVSGYIVFMKRMENNEWINVYSKRGCEAESTPAEFPLSILFLILIFGGSLELCVYACTSLKKRKRVTLNN